MLFPFLYSSEGTILEIIRSNTKNCELVLGQRRLQFDEGLQFYCLIGNDAADSACIWHLKHVVQMKAL